MARRSFTFGSPEGVDAVILAMTAMYSHHEMRVNQDDFEALFKALVLAWGTECEPGQPLYAHAHHYPTGGCRDDCWRSTAGSLASSIAEVYGIDWV